MGRRSINTTKSGKYMNPTDQARKEARKKELKKNKRQRQMVRAAVLKNKDPAQILEEMEKIDEMEYNVLQPSPLNEKVLRDKRKKLKETFDRVMRLYHNDEPEHWADLKRKEVEYEKKRLKKQQYYESVKHAQSVQIDEIPLPSATQAPPTGTTGGIVFSGPNRLPPPPTALSLPAFAPGAPPGVLKKPNDNSLQPSEKSSENKKEVPGVPPNPPPDLFEMGELDTDAEDDDVLPREYIPKLKSGKKSSSDAVSKPNALQQRMLAISGQNIDEFMKEMESVHRKKEQEREGIRRSKRSKNDNDDNEDTHSTKSDDDVESNAASDDSETENSEDESDKKHRKEDAKLSGGPSLFSGSSTVSMPTSIAQSSHPHMTIPAPPIPPVAGLTPPMMFRPPPLRPPGGMPNFAMRMPPGPPPGVRPPPAMNMPPRMGIRMPPGPPPGLPPRMAHHHKIQQNQHNKDMGKGVTTITAKPQIRNLSADVTRFLPSTLRVKREETKKINRAKPFVQEPNVAETNKAATKDDAYLQFMNEMQGLL